MNDSSKEQIAEWLKCANDPVYFVNTYGFAFDITRGRIDKITCFPFQEDVLRDYKTYQNNIVLKSRQQGISVLTAAFVAWKLIFSIDEKILIIANDGQNAVRFLELVKIFVKNVPQYLLPSTQIKDNEKHIVYSNGCEAKAVASSDQAGRGFSTTLLIMDEAAFNDNAQTIWAGAGMSLSATNGKCIIISTPYGTSGFYYETWMAAKKKENNFNTIELHWSRHPIFNVGLKEESDEFGKKHMTSPWYEEQKERLKHDTVKIAQELDLSFEGSMAAVIPQEIIIRYHNEILVNQRPKCYFDYTQEDGFCSYQTSFLIWKTPEPKKNYIIACLPEGETVLTQNGLKKIESVDFNDNLIDKNGNATNIINKQITNNFNGFTYELKLSNIYRTTKFTGNHPIWASTDTKLKRNYNRNNPIYRFNERYWDFNFDFKKCSDIKPKDWVSFPNMYANNTLTNNEIISHWEKYKNANRIDFTVECPLLDKEFWWFVGMWLAEGWTYRKNYTSNIHTVHNKKTEKHFVDRICKLFYRYYRIVTVSEKDSVFVCQLSSSQIHDFLLENFGKYALNKKIPEWVKHLPDEFKLKLIEGYIDGDGSRFVSRNELKTGCVSISLELLEGIQDMSFSLGLLPVLHKLRNACKRKIGNSNKLRNIKRTYSLDFGHYDSIQLLNKLNIEHNYTYKNKRIISDSFFSKDFKTIYFKIKNIQKKKYNGVVYNFETSDHTFLCKNIITHNCDVGRGDGSDYSTICILDADECEQVAEYQIKMAPDRFADVINKVAKIYNEAYIAVECNSFGLATALHLKNILKYNPMRMCHVKSKKKIINRTHGYYIDEDMEIPGFQTTTITRPLIVNCLTRYMNDSQVVIHSTRLLDELRTFIYRGDKAEHAPGFHDDLIFAFGIALFMRETEVKNVFMSSQYAKALLSSFKRNVVSTNSVIVDNDGTLGQKPIDKNDIAGLGIISADVIRKKIIPGADDDLRWLY